DPAFTDAMLKINTLRNEKRDLLLKYTDAHPEVLEIDEKLSRLQMILEESVANTLATTRAKIKDMDKNISSTNEEFKKLPELEQQLISLRRESMTNEQMFAFLLEKQAEASIGASAAIAFHKILEPGTLPTMAVSPKKTLTLGISIMVGMIIGLVTVFLIHYLRATVSDPLELEDALDFPVVGVLKNVPDELEIVSQDFINLATNLHLISEPEIISVCAYGPKEGRNRVSINLAKSLAALSYNTLLIDADMYHNDIQDYFNLEASVGLAQVVRHGLDVKEVIESVPVRGLSVLPAGNLNNEIPTGVILSPRLKELMSLIQKKYDRIVINLPAMREAVDAITLMKSSELNLFVARTDRSRLPNLHQAMQVIRRFDVANLYLLLLRNSFREQAMYQLTTGPLPKIGQGARRQLLRDLVRWLLLRKGPDGARVPMPKIGRGTRRSMTLKTIRKLFDL
ncbi:MAG: GNVR domain-containing protein, partial [Bacteroidota bacterium]